jgi:uracil-DNA glycosylase family 4
MMEPQGEQAQMELRHWDGTEEDGDEPDSKWSKLLDVYAGIEDSDVWKHLRHPGIRLVPGDGPETAEGARVLVVGEAPGAVENGAGRPFAGPSGRMLDELLGLAGLAREQCFITNVVKYRPDGNRTPSLGEAIGGRPFLRAEFRIINPVLTICVGATSYKIIHPFGVAGTEALSRMKQGSLTPMRNGSYATAFFHPAFAMRYRRAQEPLEEAWSLLGEEITNTPSLAEALI